MIVNCPICHARCRTRSTRTHRTLLIEVDGEGLFRRLHLISMCREGLLPPLLSTERRLSVVR